MEAAKTPSFDDRISAEAFELWEKSQHTYKKEHKEEIYSEASRLLEELKKHLEEQQGRRGFSGDIEKLSKAKLLSLEGLLLDILPEYQKKAEEALAKSVGCSRPRCG